MIDQLISSLPAQLSFKSGLDRLYAPGLYAPRPQRRITMFTVLSGDALIVSGEQSVALAAGHSLLLYGQIAYRYQAVGPAPHLVRWCESDNIVQPLARLPALPIVTTQRIEMLQSLCAGDEEAVLDPMQRQHLSIALLIEMLAATQCAPGPATHLVAERLRQQVASALTRDWSIPELADKVGLTPRTLARRLATEGAAPGVQLVWRERILQAALLLAQTAMPIGEIASACGFASPFHFSRRIRCATGRTPGGLRRWLGQCSLTDRTNEFAALRSSHRDSRPEE